MATIVDCNNFYEATHESVELTLLKNQNIFSSTKMMLENESNSDIIHTNYLNNKDSSLDDIDMDFESSSEIELSASEYIKDFDSSSSTSGASDNQTTSIEYNNNNYYEGKQQIITNISNTTTRVIQSPYMPNIDSES